MGTKLKNAPVYFTLGQIQHNPLLSLENYVPQIQESMRKAGYPGFRKVTSVAFNLSQVASGGNANLEAPAQRIDQYQFSNVAETCQFVMAANAISFQTTNYQDYEVFWAELRRGLEILDHAVDGLSFVDRLGIRYLDAVAPREGESVKNYLAPELLGLPARMPESMFAYSFSETVLVAEGIGKVVCRAIAQNGSVAFPPDLQSSSLKLKDRFLGVSGEHAILDTDGISEEKRPYDLSEIESHMNSLHELMASCFKASVSDEAWKIWKGEDE